MLNKTTVLIVGAGPTGFPLALQLIRYQILSVETTTDIQECANSRRFKLNRKMD